MPLDVDRLRAVAERLAARVHGMLASEGYHPLVTPHGGADDDWLRCPEGECAENRADLAGSVEGWDENMARAAFGDR
jgi:hypothetical protein